jgi:hypothetical protein
MPDSATLDVLIAMVIVILVLSLVVQSIQTLTKKVFKLKSHSILNSLEDLFETVGSRQAAEDAAAAKAKAEKAKELVKEVTGKLKEMGRKSLFGNPMLDSLAKGDLLKVLTRVKAEDLLPGAVGNFQAVLAGITELKAEVSRIETSLLTGEVSAKFAAMQGAIMPLIHDLEALARGGNIDPAVFFGDLYKLRQIKAGEVLTILGEVQQGVSKDLTAVQTAVDESQKALAAAKQANNQEQIDLATARDEQETGKLKAVEAVDGGLKKIANQIAVLSTAFDAAFAPLFARLEQVEVWYDTVMQGFEERYTRHMRSVGIAISIAVVVVLNANFFNIYRSIRFDPVKTALIVKEGEKLIAAPAPLASPSPSPSPAESPAAGGTAGTGGAPDTTGTGGSPATGETTVAELKKEAQEVQKLTGLYQSFGINPLSRQQIVDFFEGRWRWRDLTETFLGWAIMVMLLSAGAPFWQDTLESLFGLKNLLRKRSDTKNIEEEKGGQPKP